MPVLAATPRIQDVPVYLDGVGSVRALNNVTVRAQVDGKLIAVNFNEGQDVKKGDVLAEIDPVIYQAQYDQAVAKKAQDEAQLANQKLDLDALSATRRLQCRLQAAGRYAARAGRPAGSAGAMPIRPRSTMRRRCSATPRSSRRCRAAPACARSTRATSSSASDATGLVIITQLQPIAVQFSLPQQQIVRVNAASAKGALRGRRVRQ